MTAATATEALIDHLLTHAVRRGDFVLKSGRRSDWFIDAKQTTCRPDGMLLVAEALLAVLPDAVTAVGGLTMGADAPACAALAGGADVKAFFIRKETKAHGLQRRIEGPFLDADDRCLIVEDVVTTGGSTLQAIDAVRDAGHQIAGVVTILDRLAGGAERIREAANGAPYEPLVTIDDIHPDRPDRAA
jgi:orotate phosphoribosyltransferase